MDSIDIPLLTAFLAFGLIALAAIRVGNSFASKRLPLITGFLVTGAIAGPSILGMIPAEALPKLRIIDQIALAFIGFAAGGELHIRELRGRLRAVAMTTGGLVISTFVLGTIAASMLFTRVPIIAELGDVGRWAVAALAGSILVARSPSSAIAIVRELRARGPFTKQALGVTVIMDAVVIVVFASTAAVADAVLTGASFDIFAILVLLGGLLISTAMGWSVGQIVARVLGWRWPAWLHVAFLFAIGAGLFRLSAWARHFSGHEMGHELLIEPLFICMVAGVTIANATSRRLEFDRLLHGAGPAVYVVFFTLTGASLDLRVLADGVLIATALVVVRLFSIAIGSFAGGSLAGAPSHHNRVAWAAYLTQAGVGLGLAKEVSAEFPAWGSTFASLMIGVIVMNQFLGPPLFKWVLKKVGEAHPQADKPEFDSSRDVLIFGLEIQSLALARQLAGHGWDVRIATRKKESPLQIEPMACVDIVEIEDLTIQCLEKLEAQKFEAVVALLSDEENLRICQIMYEDVGTRNVVVHMHDRENRDKFTELDAVPVEPGLAFTSLLDHMVRSPATTSMILGLDADQDVEEIEINAKELDHLALRDLALPVDTLVLSVVRNHRQVVSHGFTRLEIGDHLSVMGSPESLEDVRRLLEGD
ncbi:MAG: potassium transporter TrkA [bacterium]|nr:potassium transporter TrkA [bacterium]